VINFDQTPKMTYCFVNCPIIH